MTNLRGNLLERNVSGELVGDRVIIADPKSGSRLHNRGYYGTPMSGGGLELELIEGFYLLDEDKIRIFKNRSELGIEELLTYITKREPTFEIKYIVYRDLRTRGHIVKPSNITDFVIYSIKGPDESVTRAAGKRQIKYWSQAVSERSGFSIAHLSELLTTAKNTKKELMISVVDEEGDLTYYNILKTSPKGKIKLNKLTPKLTGSAVLVEDRVMLWDPQLIKDLRSTGFYGKVIGSSLQLALTESAYLMEQGILDIKLARTRRKLTLKHFIRIAKKIQPDFEQRLNVYHNLKSRGLIVKTGFKYGAHFRVYEGDPNSDHSEFLVHGVSSTFESSWEEISRAVRLAHGVRKKMLFGRVLGTEVEGEIEYINIERIKP